MSDKKDFIYISIITILFTALLVGGVFEVRTRRQLKSTRTELTEASRELQCSRDINKQLESRIRAEQERIERVTCTVNELGDITQTNISTIGECIELIRDIKEKVNILEMDLYNRNSDCNHNLHNYNDRSQ